VYPGAAPDYRVSTVRLIRRPSGYAQVADAGLEGLCPALLLNPEYDDLRASTEAFAGQLALAGDDARCSYAGGCTTS
jgi:hypothetical protein